MAPKTEDVDVVSVRVPKDVLEQFDRIAEIERRSRASMIRAMMERTDKIVTTTTRYLEWLVKTYSDPVLTPHKLSREGKTPPPQEALLAVIANLIANAAPSPDARCRSLRHRSSVKLWRTLLTLIPAFAGQRLQEESRFWPMPLQRRFHSALRAQKQKRWPHSPFSGDTSRLRFRCIDTISVLDLSAANPAMNGDSSI